MKNQAQNTTAQPSDAEKLQAALARIDQLTATVEQLKKSKTQKKELSEFFCNEKGEPIKYGNLSETKKYLEEHCPEILVDLRVIAEKQPTDLMKSAEFHAALAKRLSQ